jgi:four helix bundle protein
MYKSFEEMPVWQKAIDLAVDIFKLTESLPRKEDYGLTSQIRRSALSVPANIAESFGREHTLNKLNFYYNSRGSLAETKSHLIYCKRVQYIDIENFNELNEQIEKIWGETNKIIATLKKKTKPQP